jgi:hypothetical protein
VLSNTQGLQRIELVYFGTKEYRVYGPSRAIGDPFEWIEQYLVRQSEGFDDSPPIWNHRSGSNSLKIGVAFRIK